MDLLDLANAIRRGGLVADFLVAVAVAGLAVEALERMRDRLSSSERGAANELKRIEHETPVATIIGGDRDWEAAVDQPRGKARDFSKIAASDPAECGLTEDQQREWLAAVESISNCPRN